MVDAVGEIQRDKLIGPAATRSDELVAPSGRLARSPDGSKGSCERLPSSGDTICSATGRSQKAVRVRPRRGEAGNSKTVNVRIGQVGRPIAPVVTAPG
jgi:hypothetical protein